MRRTIWSVIPPGGNGTMMRIGLVVQPWAPAGKASQAAPSHPIAKAASARDKAAVMIGSRGLVLLATSFGRSPTIDLERAGLDPRDQFAPELDRIVEGVEPADEERVHAQCVVFQDRLRDLLGGADETRGVAERDGRARDR